MRVKILDCGRVEETASVHLDRRVNPAVLQAGGEGKKYVSMPLCKMHIT